MTCSTKMVRRFPQMHPLFKRALEVRHMYHRLPLYATSRRTTTDRKVTRKTCAVAAQGVVGDDGIEPPTSSV